MESSRTPLDPTWDLNAKLALNRELLDMAHRRIRSWEASARERGDYIRLLRREMYERGIPEKV